MQNVRHVGVEGEDLAVAVGDCRVTIVVVVRDRRAGDGGRDVDVGIERPEGVVEIEDDEAREREGVLQPGGEVGVV